MKGLCPHSTVAGHSTLNPKVRGLNLAAGTVNGKIGISVKGIFSLKSKIIIIKL
jgi:hypothetical protein